MRIRRPTAQRAGLALGVPLAVLGVILMFTTPEAFGHLTPTSETMHASTGPASVPTQTAFNSQIDHIVVVMMENHAFDNYFGTYCQKLTKYCTEKVRGIPAGTCVPKYPTNLSKGCVVPFSLGMGNLSIHQPLPHFYNVSVQSYNNGSMDGFYLAEQSGIYPFGHYGSSSAALMWDFAEQYGLGDNFFSSTLSASLANHWYLVSGTTPPEVEQHNFRTGHAYGAWTVNRSLYLDQANNTTAIEDLLNGTNLSWDWYDHSIASNYSASICSTLGTGCRGTALQLWNPMAAKAESYTAPYASHFVNDTNYFGDALGGRLPDISFLIPPGVDSDHPPASTAAAQGWMASVIDATERSPEWNHTALFITYDEYGGFWDHVPPPKMVGTNLTLGFRIPFLVISPFAKENFVSHQLGYPAAILRLIEDRFGLSCLTVVDCSAPSLLQYFNFHQAPRPPVSFPTSLLNASYPTPLQNAVNFASYPTAPVGIPLQYLLYPDGEGLDVD